MIDNSDNNVFRYVHLRSGKPVERRPSPEVPVEAGVDVPRRPRPAPVPTAPGAPPSAEALVQAKRELEDIDPSSSLILPEGKARRSGFMLTAGAVGRLSSEARAALEGLGVPVERTTYARLIEAIDVALLRAVRRPPAGGPIGGPQPGPPEPARLKAVGIADLLVVKQQIKRYEAGEIAHIENILAGESRVRTHRALDRTETVFTNSKETTHEKESELQTTERFELNRETSKTQENDQKYGFGLTLSGKYGPTVEFSSNFNQSGQTHQTEAQKNAITYAKEIVERTKERIVETTREERRLTILKEVEEMNEHRLNNTDPVHHAGIYQFVDKIYESQVFNYGVRQMFDFMIPEPSSYLWYLETLPQPGVDLPVPPIRLDIEAPSPTAINEANYLRLGARYGARGLKPPPSTFVHRSVSGAQGQGSESEEDQPRSRIEMEVAIPQGYRPAWGYITVMGITDENPVLGFSLGQDNQDWRPLLPGEKIDIGQGDLKIFQSDTIFPAFTYDNATTIGEEKLRMFVYGTETANYTVHLKVVFKAMPEAMLAWQVATYDAIAEAYNNVLLQYQQDVEALKQQQETKKQFEMEFGDPPSVNQMMIRTELKKHCLAFLRNRHLGDLNTNHAGAPPQFDIPDALEDGSQVRFLEHAFEWDQMQFVFYPYFWARPGGWADRFHARNMDPALEEFLKAGYARVVLPVRPGFEKAVAYFMEQAKVWMDEGDPQLNDPLYVSIVREIQERTGAPLGEIPVGDPWETRMPTAALLARKDETLPSWKRTAPDKWTWEPQ